MKRGVIMNKPKSLKGYFGRFITLHVITYLFFGLISMYLFSYEENFATSDAYTHFRSLDSPIVQAAALIQILRGAFFALILYPFYHVIVHSERGWLKLFGLLWGLTLIGAVNATPGSIEGFIYTTASLKEHLLGMPEVTTQMLAFSWLFVYWEKKKSI